MKFCTKCGSIWYLKKTDETKLKYVCRNCGFSEETSDQGVCVHSSRTNEDYRNFQMLNSKYVIQDPTLPRLNNVKCINSNCLTNQPNLLLIKNYDQVESDALYVSITEALGGDPSIASKFQLRHLDPSEVTLYGEIHSSTEHHLMDQEVELHTRLGLLECQDQELYQALIKKMLEEPLDATKFSKEDADGGGGRLPELSPIQREVLYIKYDDVNMKYMYICSTCGSSWKNNS